MNLYTFETAGQQRVGVEWSGQLIDLSAAHDAFCRSAPEPPRVPRIPPDIRALLRWPGLLESARNAVAFIKRRPALPVGEQILYPLEAVRILAPVPRPSKILCLVLNPEAANESLMGGWSAIPKLAGTVTGTGSSVSKPAITSHLRAEPHIGVVLGKRLQRASVSDASAALFGLTTALSISVPTASTEDLVLAHNLDGFFPMGPKIVSTDELGDTDSIGVQTMVNGKAVQHYNLQNLKAKAAETLAKLSALMTLEPGDVIAFAAHGSNPPNQAQGIVLTSGDSISIQSTALGNLEIAIT